MKDRFEDDRVDARLHEYLDGELPPSDPAAFEGDLRTGKLLRNQLNTMSRIEAWFRSTRSRAPSSLARDVERALEVERAVPARARPSYRRRLFPSLPGGAVLRWAWAPAALAAIIAVLVAIPQDRAKNRSGDVPQSPERAVSTQPMARGDLTSSATGPEKPTDAPSNAVPYEFVFRAQDATQVCLAGDFNQWRVCEAPMRRVGEGVWSLSLKLKPGRYEYMFVVDGRWVTDPNAIAHADDGFGNRNAVLLL
jgi:hypothetical protein